MPSSRAAGAIPGALVPGNRSAGTLDRKQTRRNSGAGRPRSQLQSTKEPGSIAYGNFDLLCIPRGNRAVPVRAEILPGQSEDGGNDGFGYEIAKLESSTIIPQSFTPCNARI